MSSELARKCIVAPFDAILDNLNSGLWALNELINFCCFGFGGTDAPSVTTVSLSFVALSLQDLFSGLIPWDKRCFLMALVLPETPFIRPEQILQLNQILQSKHVLNLFLETFFVTMSTKLWSVPEPHLNFSVWPFAYLKKSILILGIYRYLYTYIIRSKYKLNSLNSWKYSWNSWSV